MSRLLPPLLLCALVPLQAWALQQASTRPERCAAASAVVVATVADVETTWAPGDEGGLERRVMLHVQDAVKDPGSKTLELLLAGGEHEGWRHLVEDVPQVETGRAYLFFLWRDARGYHPLGGTDAAVPIATATRWDGESRAAALASVGDCHGY